MNKHKLLKDDNGDDMPNVGRYKRYVFSCQHIRESVFRNPCMVNWKNERNRYENSFMEFNYLFWFMHEHDDQSAVEGLK